MPRLEINNPTERIQRLLHETEELEAYAEELRVMLMGLMPETEMDTLPSKPYLIETEKERLRQHLTGRRTISNRENMQRHRMRNEETSHRVRKPRKSNLTPEQMAEIEAEIEAASAHGQEASTIEPFDATDVPDLSNLSLNPTMEKKDDAS